MGEISGPIDLENLTGEQKKAIIDTGFAAIIDEIQQKRDLVEFTQISGDETVAVDHFIAKQNKIRESLERIPYITAQISQREMIYMRSVDIFINTFIESDIDTDEHETIQELERRLDQMDFWKYKFSTMPGSGSDTESVMNRQLDSVYYVTRSGISLRLRKASLEEGRGLKNVPQPPFEKVVFSSDDDNTQSLEPQLGYWVTEYTTPKFRRTLSQSGQLSDYQSQIRIHEANGNVAGVTVVQGERLLQHGGDRINRIYFEK